MNRKFITVVYTFQIPMDRFISCENVQSKRQKLLPCIYGIFNKWKYFKSFRHLYYM